MRTDKHRLLFSLCLLAMVGTGLSQNDTNTFMNILARVGVASVTRNPVYLMPAIEKPPVLTVSETGVLHPGDTLHAKCVVLNSQQVTSIVWYLDDVVLRSDKTNDGTQEPSWSWAYVAELVAPVHRIVQHLSYVVASSDAGKRLMCRAGHWGFPNQSYQNSTLYEIRVGGALECGSWDANVHLISRGQEATRGQFPWHAAICGEIGDTHACFCGGTLIKPDIVITAAHCVYREDTLSVQDAAYMKVVLGKLARDYAGDPPNSGVQFLDVDTVRVPRNYRGNIFKTQADIAILKLTSGAQMTSLVNVACVDWISFYEEERLLTGVEGTVAGWGMHINTRSDFPTTLQWIDLPYIDQHTCIEKTAPPAQQFITYDKFCGGFVNKSKSVCRGDSGGGFMTLHNGRYYLRGVVSTALDTDKSVCRAEHYSTFTSFAVHGDWVKRELWNFGIQVSV